MRHHATVRMRAVIEIESHAATRLDLNIEYIDPISSNNNTSTEMYQYVIARDIDFKIVEFKMVFYINRVT